MAPKVRCRRIEDADAERVVTLLTRGFAARRPRGFWEHVFAYLQTRALPADAPRYGFLLESDGAAVGAILQMFSGLPAGAGDQKALRCNVSSWYVDADFRSYAPLLVSQALKQKEVTYLNISSAPHTRPIVEAQGYIRYADGVFVALAWLSPASAGIPVRIVPAGAQPQAPFEAYERDLLKDHAECGCISLWCETPERAYPFVFRARRVKGFINCAQLIYCRDVADFVRFARPLGRYLAWRGRPVVILDANGPVPGLRGKYFDDTMPKYFKGPLRPRLGDLAYTETAFFGI
ncbi:MAG TPA: acyl-CoA acyltransferase [Xanthobacteraceae bacterium]